MPGDVEMASEIGRGSPVSDSTENTTMNARTPPSPSEASRAEQTSNLSAATTMVSDPSSNAETTQDTTAATTKNVVSGREISLFRGFITIRFPVIPWPVSETPPDERLQGLQVEQIDKYQEGYARFAATINADSNFAVYRRFGTIRNRLLLYKQQELAKLEEELLKLDKEDADSSDPIQRKRLKSLRVDKEADSKRCKLIPKIEKALCEYDELLQREQHSLAMTKPNRRDYMSVVNWVWNYRQLLKSEAQYLNVMDDFVFLADEQDSHFHVFLETIILTLPARVWKLLFTTKAQQTKVDTKGISLVSKDRVNILIRSIVAVVIVALLIIPICILFNVELTNSMRTLTICIFVVIFPTVVSIFARPKNHELIAATAAYAAVLVVFLGNISNEIGSGRNAGVI